MKAEVRITKSFKRQAKKLFKKYASLSQELDELQSQLETNPELGTKLGNNSYKIRIKVKSKGKSGGLRTITYVENEIVVVAEQGKDNIITVNLIFIYDKSNTASISDNEIKNLIDNIEYP